MPWPKTGATQYHAQLGLLDKGCAIKEFSIWYRMIVSEISANNKKVRFNNSYKNLSSIVLSFKDPENILL